MFEYFCNYLCNYCITSNDVIGHVSSYVCILHACDLATTILHQSAKFEQIHEKTMSYSIFSVFAVLCNLKQNGCHDGNSIHFRKTY